MGFDVRVLEAIGVAAAVYLFVWLGWRLIWKKTKKSPVLSLHLVAISLGVWMGAKIFYPGENWVGHLGAGLIFFGAIFCWVIIDLIIDGALFRKQNVAMPIILRQLGGLLVALGTLSVILIWGYDVKLTGLVAATSGVAAVIVGFAAQDLLANVLGGFSIHITGAYKVGDWLLLDEDGRRAEVTEINWRSTRALDNDKISYEIPNSEMVKKRIVNLNYPSAEHGVRLRIGLDYDTPPALAKEVLIKCSKDAQGVLESPAPVVFTREFGDSSITYEVRFWMRHARLYNATCDEIRTALWYELGRRDMRIPFPIRTLDVRTPNVPASFASARENAAKILRSGGMLSCLSEEEAADLVAKGILKVFGPREALVTRGEKGESMFLILEGSVEVVGKMSEGPRVVLATLSTGNSFGEMSLVTGEPRNATVRAVADVMVLEIRKDDISPLIAARPELAVSIGEVLESRQKSWEEGLNRAAEESGPKGVSASAGHQSIVKRIRLFFGQ
jgi:small-conductance mechanosensitive channel